MLLCYKIFVTNLCDEFLWQIYVTNLGDEFVTNLGDEFRWRIFFDFWVFLKNLFDL
jgi:hypothetical protein